MQQTKTCWHGYSINSNVLEQWSYSFSKTKMCYLVQLINLQMD